MPIRNETTNIATSILECNASIWIQECLENIVADLTFSEKRAVVTARKNNWHIQPGEVYRYYDWFEDGVEPDDDVINDDDWVECCEIPAMAAICTRLKLWP